MASRFFALGGEMIDEDGHEDEKSLDGFVPIGPAGPETEEDKDRFLNRQKNHAEKDADNRADPTGDGDAPHDGTGDDDQLKAVADAVVISAQRRDQCGDGDEETGEGEGEDFGAGDGDA